MKVRSSSTARTQHGVTTGRLPGGEAKKELSKRRKGKTLRDYPVEKIDRWGGGAPKTAVKFIFPDETTLCTKPRNTGKVRKRPD